MGSMGLFIVQPGHKGGGLRNLGLIYVVQEGGITNATHDRHALQAIALQRRVMQSLQTEYLSCQQYILLQQ